MTMQPKDWSANVSQWGWWATHGVGAGSTGTVLDVGDSTQGGGNITSLEGFAQAQTTVTIEIDSVPVGATVTYGMSDANGQNFIGDSFTATQEQTGGTFTWTGVPAVDPSFPCIGITGDGAFAVLSWSVQGFEDVSPPPPPPPPPAQPVLVSGQQQIGVIRH
jgi:hypothetical protein